MATVFSDSQMSSDLGHQTTRADGNGCWTAPDVVEAGVAWLAEYHEAARERQRTARRRREHDKRQRQRAEGRRSRLTVVSQTLRRVPASPR